MSFINQGETDRENHTPGPWAVNLSLDKRERGYVRPVNGRQMTGALRCPAIAQVFSSQTTLEEATANAHLIAAAPSLLTVAKLAHEWICSVTNWEDNVPYVNGKYNSSVDLLDAQLRKAIKEATKP